MIREELSRFKSSLELANRRLTSDEEAILRTRLSYLHAERCELLGRVSEAEAQVAQAGEKKQQAEAEASRALLGQESAEGRERMLEVLLDEAKNEIQEAARTALCPQNPTR